MMFDLDILNSGGKFEGPGHKTKFRS